MSEIKSFYTILEFAIKIGAHPNTVRRAIKKGLISALKLGGPIRYSFRIPYSEVDRLAVVNLNEFIKGK